MEDIANVDSYDRPGPNLIMTCPHCGSFLSVSDEVREEMLHELEAWDRRFDGADTILENVMSLLSECGERAVPTPAKCRASVL